MKAKKLSALYGQQKQCVSCGTKHDLSVDHIIPKSRGGSNNISNYQIMCQNCNGNKSSITTSTPEEFYELQDIQIDIRRKTSSFLTKEITKKCLSKSMIGVMNKKDYKEFRRYLAAYHIFLNEKPRVIIAPENADYKTDLKLKYNFSERFIRILHQKQLEKI